jgi:diguanylate cyclase (GGDEF)-like protein
MVIDVDHLKNINDAYGHPAGNEALVHIANALRVAKRADDAAARWGGDEFAILLEGGDSGRASRRDQRAGARARLDDSSTRQVPVTVTIGVCTAARARNFDLRGRRSRALRW